ncbi:MAG: efflux RND transporter periplasmic adaptor subunit [Candidatus Omnitrophica bacterium]|nr:efflux RND transporter periplasmic adaptor subunit [Candidatus Omnitrophota bacterium]
MKKNKIVWIIVAIVLLSGVLLLLARTREHLSHSKQSVSKETYYCPMHPHYTSDHPGKCPICNMNLIKKEDEDHKGHSSSSQSVSDHAEVSINLQQQQLIGIKTQKVTHQTLVKTIHAYGYAAHDYDLYDAQLEYIDAWQQYYLYVIQRPIFMENYRDDWWQYYSTAQPEGRWRNIDKLKAQRRLVKAEFEALHLGITQAQLNDLRKVKAGQPWVQPNLLFFDKNHPQWVYAQILENDLGFIDVGQKAKITIPTYGETTEGIVRNVALMVDPNTRTTKVRVEMPSYRGELKENLFVTIDMPVELDEGLIVPREAILDTGLEKIVFVQTQQGVFQPRNIVTGFEGEGMVVVKSGLKEGEVIVVSGNFLLDSESRLKSALMGGHQHD